MRIPFSGEVRLTRFSSRYSRFHFIENDWPAKVRGPQCLIEGSWPDKKTCYNQKLVSCSLLDLVSPYALS